MNKLEFIQTGGWPLKLERLQEVQEAYSLFNMLGYIAGNFSIISGCNIAGSNTTSGTVFINGEVLEFVGGFTMATVIIVEQPSSKEFQNGSLKVVHKKRFATFGVGEGSFAWANFKRGFATKDIQAALDLKATTAAVTALTDLVTELQKKTAVFQSGGGMVLWNKPAAQIPAGWAEVVDWRGRMPIGWNPDDADFDTLAEQGGSKTRALTAANNGPHTHNIDGDIYKRKLGAAEKVDYGNDVPIVTVNQDGVSSTSSSGTGQPFSIMNPYRVVMFIEYIG